MKPFVPSHAIVPAKRFLLADGSKISFQQLDVGGGIAHQPILWREGTEYKLADGDNPSDGVVDLAYSPFPCNDSNSPFVAPFVNNILDQWASWEYEEVGPVRVCVCYRGVSQPSGSAWVTRYWYYTGTGAVRVQHSRVIPKGATVNFGLALFGNYLEAETNLGDAKGVYNYSRNGDWDGWLATRGMNDSSLFISLPFAKEKYPRGFKIDGNRLLLYQWLSNGDRVRPGDLSYEQIAHCHYLNQGPSLDLTTPDEFYKAIGKDARIANETSEVSPEQMRDYPRYGTRSTLEFLMVQHRMINGLEAPDYAKWHELNCKQPIPVLIDMEGKKGDDYPELEAWSKRNVMSWNADKEFQGHILFGDFRHAKGTLMRVRMNNHYFHGSTAAQEFVRTGDQDYLDKLREFLPYIRDVVWALEGQSYHGKALTPWMLAGPAGHHVDPDTLRYGWQYLGDPLCLEIYEKWDPNISDPSITPDRELKVTAYQYAQKIASGILFNGTGRRYQELDDVYKKLESKQLEESGTGQLWEPRWTRDAYARKQNRIIQYENILAIDLASKQGDIKRVAQVAGRMVVDHTQPLMPGPIGEMHIARQMGILVAAMRRAGLTKLPVAEEMGDYPLLPTRIESWEISRGCEIVFQKSAAAAITTAMLHPITQGDIHPTLIRLRRPSGAMELLQARFPTWTGSAWQEASVVRASGRGGLVKLFTITGPPGTYSLIFNSNRAGVYGPVTDGPEYSIVQAGSRSGMHEGYFKQKGGVAIWFRNGLPGVVDFDSSERNYVWKYDGYFAKKKEWLP